MITLIWCEDKVHGIAKNGVIPWKNSEDMQFFKNQTLHHTVVMGKNTWNSLKYKPLKERKNVVLSTNITNEVKAKYKDVLFVNNIQEVLELSKHEDIYIIGGKKVYLLFLAYADELIITTLNQVYNCDLFLNVDLSNWKVTKTIQGNELEIHFYSKKIK